MSLASQTTMAKDIHPTYYSKSKTKCSCGNKFSIPATKEEIDIEVCSACHPFYSGSDKGKMRGSQVEKFRERLAKKSGTVLSPTKKHAKSTK